jgi:ribonuclease M5
MTDAQSGVRPRLAEVVVVEGAHDVARVLRAVDADVVATGGSRIHRDVFARLERAREQGRGIIVLTDPDHEGGRIRARIASAFPDCRHAHVARADAHGSGDIGVERACVDVIRVALEQARAPIAESAAQAAAASARPGAGAPTWEAFVALGLAGEDGAAQLRADVGARLRLGFANAKTLYKRVLAFGVTATELEDAVSSARATRREVR